LRFHITSWGAMKTTPDQSGETVHALQYMDARQKASDLAQSIQTELDRAGPDLELVYDLVHQLRESVWSCRVRTIAIDKQAAALGVQS